MLNAVIQIHFKSFFSIQFPSSYEYFGFIGRLRNYMCYVTYLERLFLTKYHKLNDGTFCVKVMKIMRKYVVYMFKYIATVLDPAYMRK